MGPMSCSVQTGISPNLAGSFTLVCNPNPRRVSSFLPRNRSRIRIRSRSISRVLLIITKRHFSKNRIFHSQAQPPLLSAERRWNLSVYATTSLDLPLLPFGVNDVNHQPLLCIYFNFYQLCTKSPNLCNLNKNQFLLLLSILCPWWILFLFFLAIS